MAPHGASGKRRYVRDGEGGVVQSLHRVAGPLQHLQVHVHHSGAGVQAAGGRPVPAQACLGALRPQPTQG